MGLFGLFGGWGDFDPWARSVHLQLIEAGAGDGSVRILPMAWPVDRVTEVDLPFYQALEVPAEVVPVTSRADARRSTYTSALGTASLIFLHGGRTPSWVAEVLGDTPVWLSILRALTRGASLATTSAGIMCLGPTVPLLDPSTEEVTGWAPGLGVFPNAAIASHWASQAYQEALQAYHRLEERPICAVEEHTAAVGDGMHWSVFGEGAVHLVSDDGDEIVPSGQGFELDLGLTLTP